MPPWLRTRSWRPVIAATSRNNVHRAELSRCSTTCAGSLFVLPDLPKHRTLGSWHATALGCGPAGALGRPQGRAGDREPSDTPAGRVV